MYHHVYKETHKKVKTYHIKM